ncbi:MAG: hypothetical protein VKL39_19890 [Leptolyngbyaceae bacterium]|nr:hypothetical protein [Leptolyngbyaceae bacterium]
MMFSFPDAGQSPYRTLIPALHGNGRSPIICASVNRRSPSLPSNCIQNTRIQSTRIQN